MTKSLGRTYSLLDFSGRKMHYWPGNLPRRRAVPRRRRRRRRRGITRHIVRAVLSRVTPACSRVSRGRNVPPRRLLLFSPFAIPRPTVPRQSSRCAYIVSFWKGRPGRLRRTCVKSPRACCSCRRLLSLSESTSTKNFKSKICS